MTIDEVSKFFVKHMLAADRSNTKRALENLRHNRGYKNPFTNTTQTTPGQDLVYNKFKDAGLLDDPEFCSAFGMWLQNLTYAAATNLMTLHDGCWIIDEDADFKIISVQHSEPLGQLHSYFSGVSLETLTL